MASFAAVAAPQEEGGEGLTDWQQGIHSNIIHYSETSKSQSSHFQNDEISSSGDELMTKVRKPYTITKQRERWTEEEHQKFLEALKMHGRAWRRIEEHIGSKTAVQIRSHAQKFISKLEREATARGVTLTKAQDISIPPPRPKRKPSHPYPRKAGSVIQSASSANEEENRSAQVVSSSCDKLSVGLNLCEATRKNAAFAPYNAKPSRLQRKENINMQDTKMESSGTNSSPSSLKLFGQTVVVPINESDLDANANGIFCEFTSLEQEFTPFEGQNTEYSKLENGKVSHQTCSLKPQTKLVKSGNASTITSNFPPTESGDSPQEGTGDSNANSRCLENNTWQQGSDKQLPSKLDNSSNYLSRKLQSSVPVPVYPRNVPVQHVETGNSNNVPDNKCKPNTCSLAHEFAAMSMLNANGSSSNLTVQMQTDIQNPIQHNFVLPFPGMPGPLNPAYNNFESFGCIPGFIAPGSAPNGPLPPWHLPPSAALHHPAYAAATLAAARYWPGLVSGVSSTTMGDPQLPSTGMNLHAFCDETSAAAAVTAATVAAASAWWTLHGAIPPPFIHPGIYAPFVAAMAAEAAAVAAAAAASGNSSPGCKSEPVTETRKQDQIATMKETDTIPDSMSNNPCSQSERKVSMQQSDADKAGLLCTKSGHLESSPQDSPSRSELNAISCMEESCDAEMHGKKQNLNLKDKDHNVHSTNSYVGETTNSKFVKERSSSGSNTPSSAEPETDACLETNTEMIKGNNEGDFELNGTGNCLSEAGLEDTLTKVGGCTYPHTLAKIEREKNNSLTVQDEKTDEIRKHIPKDRHQSHGGDSSRRSKSGVHLNDTWKEVSEEGRIAFQALFSRDILPQSFSPPHGTRLQDKIPKSSDESLCTSTKQIANESSPDGTQTDTHSSLLNESHVNNSDTQAKDDCAQEMHSNTVASHARETKSQNSEATFSDQSLEECGDCGTCPLPNRDAAFDIQPTKSSVIPSFGNFRSGLGFVPYQRCSVEAKKSRLHARPAHNSREGMREEKRICLEQEVKES